MGKGLSQVQSIIDLPALIRPNPIAKMFQLFSFDGFQTTGRWQATDSVTVFLSV